MLIAARLGFSLHGATFVSMVHEYSLNVMPVGVTELYCLIYTYECIYIPPISLLSPSTNSSRNCLSEETTYRVAMVLLHILYQHMNLSVYQMYRIK